MPQCLVKLSKSSFFGGALKDLLVNLKLVAIKKRAVFLERSIVIVRQQKEKEVQNRKY